MIALHFIGIGMGNPDHLTAQAIRELNQADVIIVPRKGADKADLADLRRQICDKVLQHPVPIVNSTCRCATVPSALISTA